MKPIDEGLLGADALIRKTGMGIIKNAGKLIALIAAVLSVLITFTDISFAGLESRQFTANMVMMLIATYVIYFSLEDAGERLGEESEEYIKSLDAYTAARGKINGSSIGSLRGFCIRYSQAELDYRRKNMLVARGYSPEEYDLFISGDYRRTAAAEGENTPENATRGVTDPHDAKRERRAERRARRRARRYFKRVRRTRAVPITPTVLLSHGTAAGGSELRDPQRAKPFKMIMALLPTTVCMGITVSVILTMKEGVSAAAVIESILKLGTLPIVAFKGYTAGYAHVERSVIPWLNTKTKLLEAFLSEQER